MSFFSVIVPVYNAEKYIKRCVESILQQTFQDFELLLIDDASEDNSRYICEELCKEDTRVHYHLISHGGSSAARNRGLELGIGKYGVFVDSDDYLAKETLEHIYEVVEKSTPDLCYMCKHYTIAEGKEPSINTVFEIAEKNYKATVVSQETFLNLITENDNSMPGSSCVIVVNMIFLKTNQLHFDRSLIWSEDTDFSFKLFTHAESISWCDFCGYYYDLGNINSVSKKITWNKAVGRMQVYKKWADYFISEEAVKKYDEESRKRIIQQLLAQYCEILYQYNDLPTKDEVRELRSLLNKEYGFWKQCKNENFRDYVNWGIVGGTLIQKIKKTIKRILKM